MTISPEQSSIRILHISDLHAGKEASLWRTRQVFGDSWVNNLATIVADKPPDYLFFTGDLAQAGKPANYDQVSEFLDELIKLLGLPKSRLFVVPGNHDIDRSVNKSHWRKARKIFSDQNVTLISSLMVGAPTRPPFTMIQPQKIIERQAAYRKWLNEYGLQHALPGLSGHPFLGYCYTSNEWKTPLHIIGLDSAWLAGDDGDAKKLLLTDEQIGRLLTDASGNPLKGAKIILLHHPLDELLDADDARRELARAGASLVLHGHIHDPQLSNWRNVSSAANSFNVAAAGCLYQHNTYPNSIQVIDLDIDAADRCEPTQVWLRSWSRKGHWHNDDAHSDQSDGGRLRLVVPPNPESRIVTAVPTVEQSIFRDHCVVDPDWLERAASDLTLAEKVEWHSKIRTALALVEANWSNLDSHLYQLGSRHGGAARDTTRLKQEFYKAHDILRKCDMAALRPAYSELVSRLKSATDVKLRMGALRTFLSAAALNVLSALQLFEGMVVVDGNRVLLRFFPDLPRIDWGWPFLCYPRRHAISSLCYGNGAHAGFIKCRIYPRHGNGEYEKIFLPRLEAEFFQDRPKSSEPLYYNWILPQFLLYGYEWIPALDDYEIGTLSDAYGKERVTRDLPKPWEGSLPVQLSNEVYELGEEFWEPYRASNGLFCWVGKNILPDLLQGPAK